MRCRKQDARGDDRMHGAACLIPCSLLSQQYASSFDARQIHKHSCCCCLGCPSQNVPAIQTDTLACAAAPPASPVPFEAPLTPVFAASTNCRYERTRDSILSSISAFRELLS